MELNELILESISIISEGKHKEGHMKEKNVQPTNVQFTDEKKKNIEDMNVKPKDKASHKAGIEGSIPKENENPQGEGGDEAVPTIQSHPKLAEAIAAGITGAKKIGIEGKFNTNSNIKFKQPEPASNEKGELNK